MTLSIRARLTAWYSLVVVVALLSGTLVVDVLQERIMLQRLDDELGRQMSTLQGVMRTEFGEGLTLHASADEASIEVIAPDRALVLTQPGGQLLAMWGHKIDPAWRPDLQTDVLETVKIGTVRMRLLSARVNDERYPYVAAVMAPLQDLEEADAQLRYTLLLGVIVALAVAAAGGWLLARQTLQPLGEMAAQAAAISESNLDDRLRSRHEHDELGKLAVAFNGLLDRLVHALHAQRQFMADASHELRSPVSVVRSTAQVTLAREERPTEEYREMMTIVGEQAERLTHLVETMMLLSRAESNGLPVVREPVYLDEVVEESARALRVIARDRGIEIRVGGDTEVMCVGDHQLLRRMMTNLLDNAVRHARPGGSVSTTIRQQGTQVAVRVADDGPGVPEHERSRIFERFVRLRADYPGAGLGLPIARWIAEAHGGELVLESSGPGGSVFAVILSSDPAFNAVDS